MMSGNFNDWVAEQGGFGYYRKRMGRVLGDFDMDFMDNFAVVRYKNYRIMAMKISNGSIRLIEYPFKEINDGNSIVQKKLHHEYIEFFDLQEGNPFVVTQYSEYAVLEYIDLVRSKINAGFERYSELIYDQNLNEDNVGFLRININNAFSLAELNELIDSYNKLYSIIFSLCEKGYERTEQLDYAELEKSHNMILESIHIGSEGFLVSVGAGLIVELVKALVSAVLANSREEAKSKREELLEKAESERFLRVRKEIFELITILDRYLDKKEKGLRPEVGIYLEHEIHVLVERIEKLQGTEHVDVAV